MWQFVAFHYLKSHGTDVKKPDSIALELTAGASNIIRMCQTYKQIFPQLLVVEILTYGFINSDTATDIPLLEVL